MSQLIVEYPVKYVVQSKGNKRANIDITSLVYISGDKISHVCYSGHMIVWRGKILFYHLSHNMEKQCEQIHLLADTNSEDGGKASKVSTSFNYINSIIGSGIICMPYAIQSAGIVLGLLMLALLSFLLNYTLRLVIRHGAPSSLACVLYTYICVDPEDH